MRNDIKRFSVAVLAACGLAVSAALASSAAPDITDRLQNLGIPLIGRYPDGKITQSTYARNVWDMKLHDGRVFFGSGNSANKGPSPNAGPAEVWEIDPATGTAQFSYKIGGEQADLFRVFGDGCLYVPDHDPPGTTSYNCYYKRDTSGNWSNGGWLTGENNEVHVYDMAEFDGKMFACGYYLWRSDDGGATWYEHGKHAGRNYAFLPYGDQLMTSTSYYNWNSSDVFRYWNKAKQTWDSPGAISAAKAFPDQSNLPGNYLKLVRPAQFGNKCLYIGAYELNDHQNDPFGAYASTFNGKTFNAVALTPATGQVPWDILVKDGTAYLLVQDKTLLAKTEDRRYVNRVFASTDATSWTELFSFRATTFAMSLEKVGDTFYFGMGTKDRVCDECGTIYRVNPTAGPVVVNFPTLTQSVSEGAGQTTVTVQLSTAAAEDVTVPLTLGGTAISGVDYSSVPTTVVIPAGSTTATFDIALVDDALFEVAETLILTMGAPTHAIAGSASKLTITITDNDGANKPAVRFASESQDAVAGSTASLVASLTKVSGAATTIGLSFEGTATNNLDYTVDKTSVTIPAGETEATVSFKLLEQAAGKTVIASIKYWPSNADMGEPRIHTMTIAASEAPPPALPTAAFASAAQAVQENAGTVSISVVLSQASSSAVSIPFTLGGTALAGTDYQIPASPLTIPAGQTSGTIDIVLAADGLAEPAETIIVELGTPTGATLGATTTHTLTIAASEAPPPALPTAAFASAAQTVQENAGTVSISVVLSQASSSAVSIPFTLGGTALAGADYQIPASPLTIPAGQTSGTIDIVLAADGLAEPAETIIVVLGTPTGATLGATTTHTLTIAASEAAPQTDYAAIYVSGVGSDANDGKTVGAPFRTLTKALSMAEPGSAIHVAAGLYDAAAGETFPLVANGIAGLRLVGDGPAQVLVDAGGGDGALALQNCPNAVVQGMSFKNAIRTTSNGTDAHAYGGGLALLFSGGVVVENCAFENNKVSSASKGAYGGGVGLFASTATIRGCRFIGNDVASNSGTSYAYGGGVANAGGVLTLVNSELRFNSISVGSNGRLGAGLYANSTTTASNCLVVGNCAWSTTDKAWGDGVYFEGSGTFAIRQCTIAANAGMGLSVHGPTVSLSDTILWGNGLDLHYRNIYSTLNLTRCVYGGHHLEQSDYAGVSARFNAADCATADPLFGPDFSLPVGSPYAASAVVLGYQREGGARAVVDIHVAATGSDETGNGSVGAPYRTLTKAASSSADNAVIHIGAGSYDAAAGEVFPVVFEKIASLRLVGAGETDTIIDGTGANQGLLSFITVADVQVSGLTFTGANAVSAGVDAKQGGAVAVVRSGGMVFRDCRFADNTFDVATSSYGGGVGFDRSSALVERCWMTDNTVKSTRNVFGGGIGAYGGTLDVVACVVVSNKIVTSGWGARGGGVCFHETCGGLLRNSLVVGNQLQSHDAANGVYMAQGHNPQRAAALSKIEHSTILDNVYSATRKFGAMVSGSMVNTIVRGHVDDIDGTPTSLTYCNIGDGTFAANLGCQSGDPLFRNSATGNYTLRTGSPCVDAGCPLPWMDETAVDVYGRPRKQGKGPDIGAAEALPARFIIRVR